MEIQKLLKTFLILAVSEAALLCIGKTLVEHHSLIMTARQVHVREGSVQALTDLFLRGESPYNAAHQPVYFYPYSSLFNFFVLPFAKIFGSTLAVHRWVAAGFFWLALLLMGTMIVAKCKNRWIGLTLALAAAAAYYDIMSHTITLCGRPESIGIFFYLLTLFVAWYWDYSPRALIAASILGLIASQTKLYFGFSLVIIAVTLWLRDFKVAFRFIAGNVIALTVLYASLFLLVPYYFVTTVLIWYAWFPQDYASASHWYAVVWHGYRFYFALLAVALVVTGYSRWKSRSAPQADPFLVGLILFTLVWVFWLAHPYTDTSQYYNHMGAPLLLVFLMRLIQKQKRLLQLGMLASIFVLLYPPSMKTLNCYDRTTQEWEALREEIHSHSNILNSEHVVSLMIAEHRPLFDAGQVVYSTFRMAAELPELFQGVIHSLHQRLDDHLKLIERSIQEGKFDLVIETNDPHGSPLFKKSLLEKHYRLERNYPKTGVETWVLKQATPRATNTSKKDIS